MRSHEGTATKTEATRNEAKKRIEPVSYAPADSLPMSAGCYRSHRARDACLELSRRLGSTAKNGTVRINWRVLQCPVALVDYVVAHELVHLIQEDHSRAFWATLGCLCAS